MSERPPQEIVDVFYRLADLEPRTRVEATAELLRHEEVGGKWREYLLERLLGGLASGKAGSRFGCSAALAAFLRLPAVALPADEFLAAVERKLPLDGPKNEQSGHAIGRHLAMLAAYESGALDAALRKLVAAHVALAEAAESLAPAVVHALAALPPAGLLLLLDLAARFPAEVAAVNAAVRPEGGVEVREQDHDALVALLKKAEPTLRHALCVRLLRAAAGAHSFATVLSQVVTRSAWEGAEAKACGRYYAQMAALLDEAAFGADQVLQLLDARFVVNCRKFAHRSDPAFRGLDAQIAAALQAARRRVEAGGFASADLLRLVGLLDATEGGDFDTRVALPARFSEFLIARLEDAEFVQFAQRALQQEHWSFKRLVPAFDARPAATKKRVLAALLAVEPPTAAHFNVLCGLLEQTVRAHYKFGRFTGVSLRPADAEVLLELGAPAKPTGGVADEHRPLEVLAAVLRLLGRAAPEEEERRLYAAEAAELRRVARRPAAHSRALVDLLLSVVARTHRVHRPLAFFVLSRLHALFTAADVAHVVDAVCRADAEIAGDGDDAADDEEFAPISDAERAAVRRQWDAEDDDERMDTSEEEEDEEEESAEEVSEGSDGEEDAPADPQLAARIRTALGRAALESGDETDEDFELDDAQMEQLDRNLAAALRSFTGRGRKERREAVQVFRSKCLELLAAFFAAADEAAVRAALPHVARLAAHLRRHRMPELLKKTSGIAALIVEKHRSLKGDFHRKDGLLLPKAVEAVEE
ncbi:hypothetical protein M3Y99_01374000 [Aphelenchoides fujianensis]|nr:hypothetical protein M3Y99_01374000 [Aphelenchoides fujianensis]